MKEIKWECWYLGGIRYKISDKYSIITYDEEDYFDIEYNDNNENFITIQKSELKDILIVLLNENYLS